MSRLRRASTPYQLPIIRSPHPSAKDGPRASHEKPGEALLRVEGMRVSFGPERRRFEAVRGVSFDIRAAETFGLVGESGSGKTTIGRAIIRIHPIRSGSIEFGGERIDGKISKERDKEVTQKIQMIFQDPMASLNERAKVESIVAEGLMNQVRLSREERQERVHRALLDVGLLPEFSSRFPHEFSGGQRQRIGIARALIMKPQFIIADEPISALDVSIRAQVLNLLAKLQREHNLTYLFISHDLSVMRFICDRIAVIHKGLLVEQAETEALFRRPMHPYTRSLLSAVPMPDPMMERNKRLITYDPASVEGDPEKTQWVEIEPAHFVRGSDRELDHYRRMLR